MRLRAARRIAALVALTAVALACHSILGAAGRRSRWPGRYLRHAARLLGADVRIEGGVRREYVLIVANHLSWMDILVLGGATGAAFVSKDDVARWPVVGWIARQGGTIFIAREARGAVRGQADTLAAALAGGAPAAFFPEGTTGDGVRLGAFRPSLFAALFPPPARAIRVQPVAIDYGAATLELEWPAHVGAGRAALDLIGRAGRLPVVLRFAAPLDPADFADRKALAAACRRALAERLPSLRPEPPL